VSSLSNLALLLQDRGNLSEAQRIFERILEIDRKLLGDEDVNVALDLNNLGRLLEARGEDGAAEPRLREAVAILRRENHATLPLVLGNLGELLTKRGDLLEAERVFEEAVPLGLREFGESSQDVAKVRAKYGVCLLKQGKYGEAEPNLVAAFSVLRASLGDRNDRTVETARCLIELYRAWGKERQAAAYLTSASMAVDTTSSGGSGRPTGYR